MKTQLIISILRYLRRNPSHINCARKFSFVQRCIYHELSWQADVDSDCIDIHNWLRNRENVLQFETSMPGKLFSNNRTFKQL